MRGRPSLFILPGKLPATQRWVFSYSGKRLNMGRSKGHRFSNRIHITIFAHVSRIQA